MQDPTSQPTHICAKAPRSAGRPRSEAARRAVLDAAYAILVETGLAGFSTEAVASRSGVARTTIYRWWSSKGLLAIESFLAAFEPQLEYAESSDAVEDFRAMLDSLVRALNGPAGLIAASVVAEAQADAETRRMLLEGSRCPCAAPAPGC